MYLYMYLIWQTSLRLGLGCVTSGCLSFVWEDIAIIHQQKQHCHYLSAAELIAQHFRFNSIAIALPLFISIFRCDCGGDWKFDYCDV